MVPKIADAIYSSARLGTLSEALGDDQLLWLDLMAAGLDWRAYTGGVRIPRWRLRLNRHYAAQWQAGLAKRDPHA